MQLPPGKKCKLIVPQLTDDLLLVDYSNPGLCQALDQIIAALSQTIQGFAAVLTEIIDQARAALDLISRLESLPIIGQAFSLASRFADLSSCMLEVVANIYTQKGVIKGSSRVTLAIGIEIIKTVLRALEQIYLGIDIPAWAVTSVSIELPFLRQVLVYMEQYLVPVNLPPISDIEDAWLRGQISDDHAKCLIEMHGEQWRLRQMIALGRQYLPTPDQLMRLHLRGHIDWDELRELMTGYNLKNDDYLRLLVKTYEYIPTPSDLISMTIHDVFDPGKPGREEMIKELEEQKDLLDLFRSQGIGDLEIVNDKGQRKHYSLPILYWLASYRNASPTQAYEMLQRLRPNRVHRFKLIDASGNVVTPKPFYIDDLRALLKEEDYNPIYRDQLAAISYHNITRVDVRRVYIAGIWGEPKGVDGFARDKDGKLQAIGPAEQELVERNKDIGYVEDDAIALAYWTARDLQTKLTKIKDKEYAQYVCAAYTIGTLSYDGAIEALTSIDVPLAAARKFLARCDTKHQIDRAKKYIAAVRALYMRWGYDDAEARQKLLEAGLSNEKITEYLELWNIEREARRKEVVASELCQWYSAGIISLEEMQYRLSRMGYDDADVRRIIAHCLVGIAAKTARELRQREKELAREREAKEKEQERRAQERKREEEKVLARWLAARTERNLIKWWRAGLIDESIIIDTLRLKGWLDEDIERWIQTNRPTEIEHD